MIALTPVDIQDSALTSFGYDPSSQTLALTFKNDADTWHFQDVPQDVADGLAACVKVCETPTDQLFASAEPMSPDHYLTQYVRGTPGNAIYAFTKVTGASAADVFNQQDVTLPPPAPSPSPSPAPAPAQG